MVLNEDALNVLGVCLLVARTVGVNSRGVLFILGRNENDEQELKKQCLEI